MSPKKLFIPSRTHFSTSITTDQIKNTSLNKSSEQIVEDTIKFYQSVISLPSTKGTEKKATTSSTRKKFQRRQKHRIKPTQIETKHKILKSDDTKDFLTKFKREESEINSNRSASLTLLQSYTDDSEDYNDKQNDEDTDLSIKVSEKSDISLERSPLKTSLNANNKQIWCKDCEISVDAKLFQSHIHGITHLAFSKNINEEPLPDPLTLNETNIGFRMLRNQGWSYKKGLGAQEQGRRHPIPTKIKNDKLGIGVKHLKLGLPSSKLKRLNSKQSAAQYEKDRRDRIRLLAYMNR